MTQKTLKENWSFSHEILEDSFKQKQKDRDIGKKGRKRGAKGKGKRKGWGWGKKPQDSWAAAFDKGQQRTLLELSLSYTLNKKLLLLVTLSQIELLLLMYLMLSFL